MSKTLEERIREYDDGHLSPYELQLCRSTAAEILRFCEEWVMQNTNHAPQADYDIGYYEGAQNLESALRAYITGKGEG